VSLSLTDKRLLIALRKGKHFKANPGNVRELCATFDSGIEWQDSDSAGRRLLADGYAKSVPNTNAPGVLHLRLTDKGIGAADIANEELREPTLHEKLKKLPWGKAGWDVFKIGLGAAIGIAATKWFGS
jgi:hypothetical protein